jgi:hypothetical protein
MTVDLDTPIAEIDFKATFLRETKLKSQMDTRIRLGLQRGGIMTLGQLVDLREDQLPPGLGVICAEVIRVQLAGMGLRLKRRSDRPAT